MPEERIKQLCDDNFTYVTLLGYANALIIDLKKCSEHYHELPKIEWFLKAIENKLYLKIPIPPMP